MKEDEMRCFVEKSDVDIVVSVSDLKYFKDYLQNGEMEKITLLEMKQIVGKIWCLKYEGLVIEMGCGRICDDYSPCNGKNECRHLRDGFVKTGRTFELTKKGLRKI